MRHFEWFSNIVLFESSAKINFWFIFPAGGFCDFQHESRCWSSQARSSGERPTLFSKRLKHMMKWDFGTSELLRWYHLSRTFVIASELWWFFCFASLQQSTYRGGTWILSTCYILSLLVILLLASIVQQLCSFRGVQRCRLPTAGRISVSPPFVIPPWQYVSLKVSGFGGREGNQRPSLPVSSRTILLVVHGFVKPNK